MRYLYCACLMHSALDGNGKRISLDGAVPPRVWFDKLLYDQVEPWLGPSVIEEADFAKAAEFGTRYLHQMNLGMQSASFVD